MGYSYGKPGEGFGNTSAYAGGFRTRHERKSGSFSVGEKTTRKNGKSVENLEESYSLTKESILIVNNPEESRFYNRVKNHEIVAQELGDAKEIQNLSNEAAKILRDLYQPGFRPPEVLRQRFLKIKN